MYSKEKAASITKKDIKFISAGIQENVVLKSARAESSPNNVPFLEIVFEKDGATVTHTEWKPKLGKYVTNEEELQAAESRQYSRMLQILYCFYKDEELNFVGNSFEEFSQWVADMLNNADKTKKLKVKIVYNNKGYTTLPGYSTYTFIEPMELPEGQTSAIMQLGIDQFTKPVVADVEKVEDPLNTSVEDSASTEGGEDLPF